MFLLEHTPCFLLIDDPCKACREYFRKWKSNPYADSPLIMGEQQWGRKDDDQITKQRNTQRWHSCTEPFQSTTADNRSAAPAIPMRGKMPIPKISKGSNIILAIKPTDMQIMDIFILPIDWKIFSNAMPTVTVMENANAILEYMIPREITSLFFVNTKGKL